MFENFVVLYRMKELTKAEEQVMQILWNLQEGFVKDIIQKFPDPKPAVTTVSTIIRILEKKEFVSHKAYGNSYMYYPTVTKKEYTKTFMSNFVKNYFEDSYSRLVSFFAKEGEITLQEIDELKSMLDSEVKEN